MQSKKSNPLVIWQNIAIILLVAVGIIIRFIHFIGNRSLFIDEANLARNYAERNFTQLFQHLDYEQFAPPLFSVAIKSMTMFFGFTEQAMWLVPFLFSIISIVLFIFLGKFFLSTKELLFPLAIFCCSSIFIEYSVVAKQYASDIAITLLILLIVVKNKNLSEHLNKALFLGLFGALLIWFSMPVVFILASVGLYFFLEIKEFPSKKRTGNMFIMFSLWLGSFLLYYFLLLKEQAGSSYLQEYHANYFLPFPPMSLDELNQLWQVTIKIFTTVLGPTVLGLAWAMLCFCIGLWIFAKVNFRTALLIASPIFLCLIAAALHQYSLIPRLSLFFVALMLLIIGKGAGKLMAVSNTPLKIAFTIIMIIAVFNINGLTKSYDREAMKPVLAYIHQQQPNQPVFVYHLAAPSVKFYTEIYKNRNQYNLSNLIYGHWDDEIKTIEDLEKIKKNSWIIFSNISAREKNAFLNNLNKRGALVDSFIAQGASCYFYSF